MNKSEYLDYDTYLEYRDVVREGGFPNYQIYLDALDEGVDTYSSYLDKKGRNCKYCLKITKSEDHF